MKRILTLMVMTLLIAAVPQTTFSKVKKTKKTTKTTKTTKSTSKKSNSSTTASTTINSATTNTSSNTQTYPVPKSYVNYANSAPEIITRIKADNGWSTSFTDFGPNNTIYGGRDAFSLEFGTIKDREWAGKFYIFSYNEEIINLAKYINEKNIDYQEEKVVFTFSNGTKLKGVCSLFQSDNSAFGTAFRLTTNRKFFNDEIDGSGEVLSFDFFPHSLGDYSSSASDDLEHIQYVSSLFTNYNITKLEIGNKITIPIEQNKWGSKHTFLALFNALAEDSENYEAFGLTAPASSGSSYSSSSSSSSTTSTTPSYNSSSSSSSSTYTTPSTSTYSTPSYNYSYKLEPKKRFWGFSAGYVQKQWQSKEGGSKEKMGFWEDSKVVHGVQAGFRATPYFKFGLGLNTGLLYEYYYTKSQPMVVDGYDVYGEMQEHALYMPVHLTYRLKFNDFHIYAFGGVGLDYGIMSKVQLKENGSDYVGYDNSPLYETEDAPDWKRFNASYEFGGGLRYKMVELQFTMSRGFLNMSHDSSYKLYQNKPMMFSLGFMF